MFQCRRSTRDCQLIPPPEFILLLKIGTGRGTRRGHLEGILKFLTCWKFLNFQRFEIFGSADLKFLKPLKFWRTLTRVVGVYTYQRDRGLHLPGSSGGKVCMG